MWFLHEIWPQQTTKQVKASKRKNPLEKGGEGGQHPLWQGILPDLLRLDLVFSFQATVWHESMSYIHVLHVHLHVPIELSCVTLPVSFNPHLIIKSLSFTPLLLWILCSWITVTISAFWWFPMLMFMFLFLLLFMYLRFSVPFSLFFMTGVLVAFIWITFTCCGLIK